MKQPIIEISDLNEDPRLKMFSSLTDSQLRQGLGLEDKIFIAESPKVIKIALEKGFTPVAFLCEKRHIEGDAKDLLDKCPAEMPVFTGERNTLAQLTGYTLSRGVLCAMKRPALQKLEDIVKTAKRICVLDGVVDSTNTGSIFRSAAALDIDAVVLSSTCCEPLNRRVVRVSMGTVFLVPWTIVDCPVDELKKLGFCTVALALRNQSFNLGQETLNRDFPRLAMVFGAEGDGLSKEAVDACDYVVKIPMSHEVDSLNVGAAAAVVFWHFRQES